MRCSWVKAGSVFIFFQNKKVAGMATFLLNV